MSKGIVKCSQGHKNTIEDLLKVTRDHNWSGYVYSAECGKCKTSFHFIDEKGKISNLTEKEMQKRFK